jgi:hypothetical protein
LNLFTSANAEFTNWVVKAGYLREPFVLVDVGVQGGESPSWHRLGDYLVVLGFDAIEDALELLEVPEEGHAPRLTGALTIDRISGFIASCDATGPGYRS